MTPRFLLLIAALSLPAAVAAQEHAHRPGMTHDSTTAGAPHQPGQAVFGAISEIVRILMADSTTDWPRVDVEALRRHLLDMDDVIMRSAVTAQHVPGGARYSVTGTGRTVAAIRRMAHAHAAMLGRDSLPRMTVEDIPGGARVTVVAARADDARMVAQIRGLGFVGLLTLDDHHAPHHLAIARGAGVDAHTHPR